jgi:uncharacterized phiE125 gp8 family phage protein
MAAILLTPPEAEPLSVTDAKEYLRVETSDDDVLIASLIAAARSHVEALSRCVLLTQTWRLALDGWPPDGCIKPRLAPLNTVTAARVYDEAGAAHVIDPENFVLDAAQGVIAVRPCSLPQPGRAIAGIEIDVAAGFGYGEHSRPSFSSTIPRKDKIQRPRALGAPRSGSPPPQSLQARRIIREYPEQDRSSFADKAESRARPKKNAED